MKIIEGGWATELLQCLRNCASVLKVLKSSMKKVVLCTLYIAESATQTGSSVDSADMFVFIIHFKWSKIQF